MTDGERVQAIDGLITPNAIGGAERRPPADYLHASKEVREGLKRGVTGEQLVDEMEQAGVEKGIVDVGHFLLSNDDERAFVRAIVAAYPKRFLPAIGVNPLDGMEALRKMEYEAKHNGIQVIRMGPWRIQKPPNDRIYYPFYAKAIELGLIVQINVGFPGPKVPAWVQDPIHLDDVCAFFPELKLVMTHLGEPWVGTVIKMLLRWENAYLLTNAVAPKYYPNELIQFMNTRGADKVLFGSEYPFLPFKRCMDEIANLDLRDHVRRKFLRENALRLFT